MDKKDLILKVEKLLSEITPGPWLHCEYNRTIQPHFYSPAYARGNFNICKIPMRTADSLLSHQEWEANSRLIAEAPTLMGQLLDVLKNG